ncbi:MAG: hypothetical protein KAW89_02635 [Armatimonadetes bacterium]|nr:hypothetical protein [Armatimonadota bacterium]
MKRMILPALLFALLIASSTAWAEEAPDQQTLLPSSSQVPTPELNLFDVVSGATVGQRARMSRLLANKYPSLTQDLSALLTVKYPQVLNETTVYVDHLLKTKYPEIPALILTELQSAPAVQTTIEDLVNKKYPDLIPELVEIANSADAGDLQAAVAQVIQEKHPKLVADVLTAIRAKFPSLLTRLQHQVLSRHPGILIDVADMVQRRYPDFTNDVLVLILTEYPDLVSEVIATLSEVPSAEAAPTVEGSSVDLPETSPASGDEVPKAEEAAGTTTSDTGDVAEGE